MNVLSWTGPVAVAASVVYAYLANHPTAAQHASSTAYVFPLSTSAYCGLLFCVYASGILPRNPLFPPFVWRGNIFLLLYRLYCSYGVGYRLLSGILHQPVAYPHSDYRNGIRCLDAGSPVRLKPPPLGAKYALPFLQKFYARGGGVVDAALWSGSSQRGVVVMPVPMFGDNYAFLILSLQTSKVAVVDPADAAMVLRVLGSLRTQLQLPLQLTDVLTTHKHWDHAGGNQLLAAYAMKQQLSEQKQEAAAPVSSSTEETSTEATEVAPAASPASPAVPLVAPSLNIIGSDVDRPLACTVFVNDASPVFEVAGGGVKVRAMAAPGHTKGSLVFIVGTADPAAATITPARVAAFTGDAIFSGGCGAPFETVSVTQVIKTRETFLEDARVRTQPATGQSVEDEDVLLYTGHEYTERLLGEVVSIVKRVVASRGSSADPRGQQYLRSTAEALKAVKVLREESDGLKDASLMGQEGGGQAKPVFRIPSCTLPTSLAVEKAINPLLTVDDEDLAALATAEKEGQIDVRAVERAIYCTDRRCVPVSAAAEK